MDFLIGIRRILIKIASHFLDDDLKLLDFLLKLDTFFAYLRVALIVETLIGKIIFAKT